jgi:hypothetical protein
MWAVWAVGNTDYFKTAAPLPLINVGAGIYYGSPSERSFR